MLMFSFSKYFQNNLNYGSAHNNCEVMKFCILGDQSIRFQNHLPYFSWKSLIGIHGIQLSSWIMSICHYSFFEARYYKNPFASVNVCVRISSGKVFKRFSATKQAHTFLDIYPRDEQNETKRSSQPQVTSENVH